MRRLAPTFAQHFKKGERLMSTRIETSIDWDSFYTERLGNLKRYQNGHALALCPFHPDRNPSFSIDLQTGLWHCFGCGESGNAITFLEKFEHITTKEAYKKLLDIAGIKPSDELVYTLEDYALEKKLPQEYLQQLGLSTAKNCVQIVYKDEDGNTVCIRQRYHPASPKRFSWKRGSKIIPYGLWKLGEAKEKGFLILVEGESDAQTLWFHQIPALGIPGATTWKDEWIQFVRDIPILYIFVEPDQGGAAFLKEIGKSLLKSEYPGTVYKISCEGFKDISDMHIQCSAEDFVQNLEDMYENAELVDLQALRFDLENGVEIESAPVKAKVPAGWRVSEEGILRKNERTEEWELICATPVLFMSQLENVGDDQQALEIVFRTPDKKRWKSLVVPPSVLFTAQNLRKLADYGISVGTSNDKALAHFLQLLYAENASLIPMKKAVGHMGWWGSNFLPGAEDNLTLNPPPGMLSIANAYRQSGSLEKWVKGIKPYRANPIFRFLVSASFAAPLLKVIGQRSFTIHTWGRSRSGKTAALKAALSVWGCPEELLVSFYGTKTGLERILAFHHNLPVGVDERQILGDGNQDLIEALTYIFSEGKGKHRGNAQGGLQEQLEWNTIIFTTGEQPVVAGTAKLEGVGSRILELKGKPCKSEMDAISLHGFLREEFGTAGPVYIAKLVEILQTQPKLLKNLYREFETQLTAKYLQTQVAAHISYIAVVVLADFLSAWWIFGDTEEQAKKEAMDLASEIADVLANSNNSDPILKIYRDLEGWLFSNIEKFYTGDNLHDENIRSEIFGKVEPGKYLIFPWALNKGLKELGFENSEWILDAFAERGYISTWTKTRNGSRIKERTKVVKLKDRTARVIEFLTGLETEESGN